MQSEDFLKNNLRELRKRSRLSQQELGARAGFAHNTVSLYESGRIELTNEAVEKFAKALEIEPAAIEVFNEDMLREQPNPYGNSEILPIEYFTDEELHAIDQRLSGFVADSHGKERAQIIEALQAVGREKERRARLPEKTKDVLPGISSDVKISALAGRDIAGQMVKSRPGNRERPPSGKAASPTGSKAARDRAAHQGSKAGSGGQSQAHT